MSSLSRRVFVVGAGFSKAAGFPLASELTDALVQCFRMSSGGDHELPEFAAAIIELQRTIAGRERVGGVGVEEFFECAAVVAERLRADQHFVPLDRHAGETPFVRATDIDTWMTYLDDHLLEVLLDRENAADLRPISRFAMQLSDGDAVISFNYDRLIERCLADRGCKISLGFDEAGVQGVQLLKMHGSMDWISIRRNSMAEEPGLRRLFRKRDRNRERTHGPTDSTGEHEYDFETWQITSDERLRNLIRGRHIIQREHRWGLAGLGPNKRISQVPGLGCVWQGARKALYDADEVVIIGFSFSPLDRMAQLEFARVMNGRQKDGRDAPRLVVIDPAATRGGPGCMCSPLARIEAVFGSARFVSMRHENIDWPAILDESAHSAHPR